MARPLNVMPRFPAGFRQRTRRSTGEFPSERNGHIIGAYGVTPGDAYVRKGLDKIVDDAATGPILLEGLSVRMGGLTGRPSAAMASAASAMPLSSLFQPCPKGFDGRLQLGKSRCYQRFIALRPHVLWFRKNTGSRNSSGRTQRGKSRMNPPKRIAVGAVAGAAAATALMLIVGSATPAQADSDYRRESETTFYVSKPGSTPTTRCNGWAWVGQTWNGYIEASTRVTCPGEQLGYTARARIATAKISGVITTHSTKCGRGKTCSSSVSTYGSNGKTYCNQAYAATLGAGSTGEGFGTPCIYT